MSSTAGSSNSYYSKNGITTPCRLYNKLINTAYWIDNNLLYYIASTLLIEEQQLLDEKLTSLTTSSKQGSKKDFTANNSLHLQRADGVYIYIST